MTSHGQRLDDFEFFCSHLKMQSALARPLIRELPSVSKGKFKFTDAPLTTLPVTPNPNKSLLAFSTIYRQFPLPTPPKPLHPPDKIQSRGAPAPRKGLPMQNHSTGPRTAEGKQRSSLNALRHGLTGQTVVIPSDDRQAHDKFSRDFFHDLQPQTAIERQLVQTIVDCSWRLNRLRAHEQTLLSLSTVEMESEVNTQDDRCATACASALAFEKNAKTLGNLTIYEQRISRAFDKARQQLKEEQAERKANETRDLARAAELKAHHDEQQAKSPQPLPYNPRNDGFVFSNDFIDERSGRENRYRVAHRAADQRIKAAAA